MIDERRDDVLRFLQCVVLRLPRFNRFPEDFAVVPRIAVDDPDIDRVRGDPGGKRTDMLECVASEPSGQ
jgi:hypothetical protein